VMTSESLPSLERGMEFARRPALFPVIIVI
jgi:hypothetical protein